MDRCNLSEVLYLSMKYMYISLFSNPTHMFMVTKIFSILLFILSVTMDTQSSICQLEFCIKIDIFVLSRQCGLSDDNTTNLPHQVKMQYLQL